ncbi:3-methyl-2-oxobutanoate hydroxymethyltransferase [Dehalogenimonas etheniformans]|uniref:3-methyl-2-oxobutanoate hydroxymethyltransferase n=1 Tax=Dehalogenimonas etheniformans TaxID=1536648 RepID=A0A2P5P967_9CHLR|nr:3-methyl-2-oxobutanoate hydroxymethyltransferase [Dehalogenimonas etheniformans]PPD58848.1 3-methyl-2-oxobutanoate hydroxymethyltransferase [Dehalogenimonas etheniformans]QNT76384.1 3-methyl-2-oxobutanoate hydroxymethyltransferase [Dehalogenimonas etheniformans]
MRTTIQQIKDFKLKGEKFAVLTAYDYPTAQIVDRCGIPVILVGDSLGNVVLGYDSTIPVTIDDMIHHTKAVVRGAQKAMVVGDMPFMTYQINIEDTLRNAARFLQEAGAQAVKLEGGVTVADKVKKLVVCGIPVMGHIGLTPQSINQLSGHKVQGRSIEAARRVLADAKALEEAGAFAVVLETIPAELAAFITSRISIPTIGIGAGLGCDGQVQVISDLLGLFTDFVPKHAGQYGTLAQLMSKGIADYANDVINGSFPAAQHSFTMDPAVIDELRHENS